MRRALVADDTKNIRTLLTTCLEIEGFEVLTASSGLQALNLIINEAFDLIFLDIKMPEISGTEVLRKIRELGIVTPVIIMTAFATVKNAVECTKMGAIAYLQKPFTADKVRIVLSEIKNCNLNMPQDADTYITSSRQLIEEGRLEAAFDLLKKALSLNPSSFEIYQMIGDIYEKKGNMNEAIKFFETAKHFKKS